MKVLKNIGSFFRRFFSIRKWINPGFLNGPYLPMYGFGALLFHERNLRAKAVDLLLILVGMFFLWIGSK